MVVAPNPAGEKESRTPAQQKLDSHLVLALKKSRAEPPFDKPVALDPDVAFEADGRVMVDIKATVSADLLAQIRAKGGEVINSFEAAQAIRARLLLPSLEALASRPDIQFIAPAAQSTTNAIGGSIKP